jgi:molybdopterin-binding protein
MSGPTKQIAEGASADTHAPTVRIGEAAEMLGVTIETLRRWAAQGRLETSRSGGGQRLVPFAEVSRLLRERRPSGGSLAPARGRRRDRPAAVTSARNRFAGVVTRIERDRVAAVVEIQAGPHRLVSLMTAEAVEELGLAIGDDAVCVVKATNVIVERAPSREGRG